MLGTAQYCVAPSHWKMDVQLRWLTESVPVQGYFSTEARQMMSKLIFNVFTPALLFEKLAVAVTWRHLVEWWPLSANMAVAIAGGFALGYLLVKLIRPPPDFRPHTIVSVGVGNVGNLPLGKYSFYHVDSICTKPGLLAPWMLDSRPCRDMQRCNWLL